MCGAWLAGCAVLLLLPLTTHGADVAPLPTVVKSVYWIQYADKSGAAFAIEVDERQYLITAKHVVPGIPKDGQVGLFNSEALKSVIQVTPIMCEDTNNDLIVLVPPVRLNATRYLPPTESSAALGQEVFVFGFPMGYYTSVQKNIIPFVGKGIISAVDTRNPGAIKLFFHTTAAHGFSGGPIVSIDQRDNTPRILGVVSGCDTEEYPVFNGAVDTGLRARVNPGIMYGYSIESAVAAIRKQPIGPLAKGE